MTNRRTRFTQAEIQRVIRAGKKEGVAAVELKIGDKASVRIPLAPDKPETAGSWDDAVAELERQ
jgi:hypothetical protein